MNSEKRQKNSLVLSKNRYLKHDFDVLCNESVYIQDKHFEVRRLTPILRNDHVRKFSKIRSPLAAKFEI